VPLAEGVATRSHWPRTSWLPHLHCPNKPSRTHPLSGCWTPQPSLLYSGPLSLPPNTRQHCASRHTTQASHVRCITSPCVPTAHEPLHSVRTKRPHTQCINAMHPVSCCDHHMNHSSGTSSGTWLCAMPASGSCPAAGHPRTPGTCPATHHQQLPGSCTRPMLWGGVLLHACVRQPHSSYLGQALSRCTGQLLGICPGSC
jgi:hypothetical protein